MKWPQPGEFGWPSGDEDLQAFSDGIEQLQSDDIAQPKDKLHSRRQVLPAHLPCTDIHHEHDSTICQRGCQLKRIGEDVAKKLDYAPRVFSIERYICDKWACA